MGRKKTPSVPMAVTRIGRVMHEFAFMLPNLQEAKRLITDTGPSQAVVSFLDYSETRVLTMLDEIRKARKEIGGR